MPVTWQFTSLAQSKTPKVPQPAPKSSAWAFFGNRIKSDKSMESVLNGKTPSGISNVKPFASLSMIASIKNQPAQPRGQLRRLTADSEELAFLDSLSGAVVGTGAAADTNISVDDVLVFALGDSFDGAVVSARAALDTSIGNVVSHSFILHICFSSVL